MKEMEWSKEGVNYWDNPECPKEYLEKSLIRLVKEVEGETVTPDYFKNYGRETLQQEISFYEYVNEK